jgi:hypothetical protein
MMKKFVPENTPTDGTDNIYDEKSWSRKFAYSLHMACAAYIYDEKSGSRKFPCTLYMACAAYIYDEKSWSRKFPYIQYMAYYSLYI